MILERVGIHPLRRCTDGRQVQTLGLLVKGGEVYMGLFLEIDCKLMLKSLRFMITCFVYGL